MPHQSREIPYSHLLWLRYGNQWLVALTKGNCRSIDDRQIGAPSQGRWDNHTEILHDPDRELMIIRSLILETLHGPHCASLTFRVVTRQITRAWGNAPRPDDSVRARSVIQKAGGGHRAHADTIVRTDAGPNLFGRNTGLDSRRQILPQGHEAETMIGRGMPGPRHQQARTARLGCSAARKPAEAADSVLGKRT